MRSLLHLSRPPHLHHRPAQGAWVDQLVFTEQNDAAAAIKQIQAGDIDIYAYSVSEPDLFTEVKADPNLSYTTAFGSYTELTFNPMGPHLQ